MADKVEKIAEKKKSNALLFGCLGCLGVLVLLGIASTIAVRFFAKQIGTGIVQKAIESKTGVKTNIEDLEQGKLSFTDSKTGATVNIGSGTIPDTFPKDFPVYPGSKVTSSASGAEQGKGSGFWITLSTTDSSSVVMEYYKKQFATGGWEVEATYTAGDTTTETVKKGDWSGSVAISKTGNETTIVIVLGQDQ